MLVATPLELTDIAFTGFEVPHMPVRQFQTTVTTLVKGRLKPAYFGVETLPKGNAPSSTHLLFANLTLQEIPCFFISLHQCVFCTEVQNVVQRTKIRISMSALL